jgi:hypothetical protein
MPTLRKRNDEDEYYVLTSISGRVITFQLTHTGRDRLLAAGLQDGDRFSRGILHDLYISGDVFTYGLGATHPPEDERQLDFDFDPIPESVFPSCSKCSSQLDLFFVTSPDDVTCDAFVLCQHCRSIRNASSDVSLPLPLVSRLIFVRLQNTGRVKSPDMQVRLHMEKLEGDFQKSWDDLQKRKGRRQEILFPVDDGAQRRLIE